MLAVTRKIKYVSLSYILCGLSKISSKAFCQKKLFASPISTSSAVVTVRLMMYQLCTILSCIKVLHLKWSCVFESIAWWNNCSLTRISFPHIYCTPNLYPFKDLFSISYFMFARAYFLENEIFTKNANFLLLIWQNCQLIMIMWCSHMFSSHCDQFISLLCPILTHCDPRKSPIFPIFVTRFCDRPIYRSPISYAKTTWKNQSHCWCSQKTVIKPIPQTLSSPIYRPIYRPI